MYDQHEIKKIKISEVKNYYYIMLDGRTLVCKIHTHKLQIQVKIHTQLNLTALMYRNERRVL